VSSGHSRLKRRPNLLGDVECGNVESSGRQRSRITERKLKQYDSYSEICERDETYCRTYGCPHTGAASDVPFDEVLLRMIECGSGGVNFVFTGTLVWAGIAIPDRGAVVLRVSV